MRRRVRGIEAIPEHLLVFRPDEWPADSIKDAITLWRLARRTWADSNGGWPGGPLAQLAGESDISAVFERRRMNSWGRTAEELEAEADRLARLYGRRPLLLTSRPHHGPTPSPYRAAHGR